MDKMREVKVRNTAGVARKVKFSYWVLTLLRHQQIPSYLAYCNCYKFNFILLDPSLSSCLFVLAKGQWVKGLRGSWKQVCGHVKANPSTQSQMKC